MRESNKSKSESRDKERGKSIKMLNAHTTVIVHICMVTVAIVHKYTILHPLMWVSLETYWKVSTLQIPLRSSLIYKNTKKYI